MAVNTLGAANGIHTGPELPRFPNRITVEFTNHCNLRCRMCPRRYMQSPKGFMPFHLFQKIVNEIADHNDTALVPFFRGESLLHPHGLDMLKYATKRGIDPIQFATNATLMTKDVARALLDLEIDFISFSVDSIDPRNYRSIRKGAELRSVIKNIETFCKLKRNRRLERPEIQVSVVKTKDTSNGIGAFVRFWEKRVDRVRVYEQHSQNGSFGTFKKKRKENFSDGRKPCLKPFNDLIIYWNGSVAICNHDWDRKNDLGNVGQFSIEEIWHNDVYEKVREAHLGQERLEALCKACDHWESFYNKEGLVGELYVRESEGIQHVG